MNQTRKSLSRFTVPLLPEPHFRLTGIDAPERRQAFGNVSKESLAELVAGQSVAGCRTNAALGVQAQGKTIIT